MSVWKEKKHRKKGLKEGDVDRLVQAVRRGSSYAKWQPGPITVPFDPAALERAVQAVGEVLDSDALAKAMGLHRLDPNSLQRFVEGSIFEAIQDEGSSRHKTIAVAVSLQIERWNGMPMFDYELPSTLTGPFESRFRRRVVGLEVRLSPQTNWGWNSNQRPLGPFGFVSVKTRARTPSLAFEKAIHAVDVLRGQWMLGLADGWSQHWGNSPPTLGAFSRGPHQAVLRDDGDTSEWGNTAGQVRGQTCSLIESDGYRDNKRMIRRMHESERSWLFEIIASFARSFDDPDPWVALRAGWATLENMLGGTSSGRADRVVERAVNLLEPGSRELTRIQLETLRSRRNRLAHDLPGAQRPGWDRDRPLAWMMRRSLRDALNSMIYLLAEGRTRDEVFALLDLPQDVARLRREVEQRQELLRLLEP